MMFRASKTITPAVPIAVRIPRFETLLLASLPVQPGGLLIPPHDGHPVFWLMVGKYRHH